ncbi:hypothetical protein HK405_002808 [Cladochytrium tenue]|nr:hypothetical protein HK405_002808 [Cladochytrium tenue]
MPTSSLHPSSSFSEFEELTSAGQPNPPPMPHGLHSSQLADPAHGGNATPREILSQVAQTAEKTGAMSVGIQQMIEAAKAAAVVAENMKEMVRQMQQKGPTNELTHDQSAALGDVHGQFRQQPLPSPSASSTDPLSGFSLSGQADAGEMALSPFALPHQDIGSYLLAGRDQGTLFDGVSAASFSGDSNAASSPFQPSYHQREDSGSFAEEPAFDAFLHEFANDDHLALLQRAVVDADAPPAAAMGAEGFNGTTFRNNDLVPFKSLPDSQRSISPSDSNNTFVDQRDCPVSDVSFVGANFRSPTSSVALDGAQAAPEAALVTNIANDPSPGPVLTGPNGPIILKRKRGRPAGKRNAPKEKTVVTPAPSLLAKAPSPPAIDEATKPMENRILSADGGEPKLPIIRINPAAEAVQSSGTLKRKEPSSSDGPPQPSAVKQQRKVAHNAIERRYRNNINERITELRLVVPALNSPKLRAMLADGKRGKGKADDEAGDPEDDDQDDIIDGIPAATKLNKATVLRKATEYILHLKSEFQKARDEADQLRRLLEGLPGGAEVLRAWELAHASALQTPSSSPSTMPILQNSMSPPPSSPDGSAGSHARRHASASSSGSIASISHSFDGGNDSSDVSKEYDGTVFGLASSYVPAEMSVDAFGHGPAGRLMAVMLLSASILYAPSPFSAVHNDSAGSAVEHSPSKVLLGRVPPRASHVASVHPYSADGFSAAIADFWHMDAALFWVGMKVVVTCLAVLILISNLFNAHAPRASRAGSRAKPSLVVSAACSGYEMLRYLIFHVAGVAAIWRWIQGLRRGDRAATSAKVAARTAVAVQKLKYLDMEVCGGDSNPFEVIRLSLRLATEVDLAGDFLHPQLTGYARVAAAVGLRTAAHRLELANDLASGIRVLACHIFREGLSAVAMPDTGSRTESPGLKWLLQVSSDAQTAQRLSTAFESDAWLGEFEAARQDRSAANQRKSTVFCLRAAVAGDLLLAHVSAAMDLILVGPSSDESAADCKAVLLGPAAAAADLVDPASDQVLAAAASCFKVMVKSASTPESATAEEDVWLKQGEANALLRGVLGDGSDGSGDLAALARDELSACIATLSLVAAGAVRRSLAAAPRERRVCTRSAEQALAALDLCLRADRRAGSSLLPPPPPSASHSPSRSRAGVLSRVEFAAVSWLLAALWAEGNDGRSRRRLASLAGHMRRLLPAAAADAPAHSARAAVACAAEWTAALCV